MLIWKYVKKSDDKGGRSECARGRTVLYLYATLLATAPPAPHPMFTNAQNDTSYLMRWSADALERIQRLVRAVCGPVDSNTYHSGGLKAEEYKRA